MCEREREVGGGREIEMGKVGKGKIGGECQTSALTKWEDMLYKGVK